MKNYTYQGVKQQIENLLNSVQAMDQTISRTLKHSLAGLILCLPTAVQGQAPPLTNASVPGGIYQYALPPAAIEVSYKGKRVLVHQGHALVGIPISQTPGDASIKVTFSDGSTLDHGFTVLAKDYPEQHLTIKNKKMVNPDPENLARIRREGKLMRTAYAQFSPSQGDPQPFVKPVDGVTTSPFGRRRVLNGQPRNPHSGLDIAGATGTPINAPSPATVAVTGDFYFNGNTILLDHGQGLVTMYCHLSEIQVKQGQQVSRGDVIGLVGATGRVTGPHLHWSVSLNGNRVDPLTVMAALAAEDK